MIDLKARVLHEGRRSYDDGGSSYRDDGIGDYVRPDGSYRDGGMSYARGRNAHRDAMGRYSSSGDEITEKLHELMETATDDRTRNEIRKLIDRM